MKNKKIKVWLLIIIIVICLFIALLLIGFITSHNSTPKQKSNGGHRNCVATSNEIMSCDGEGIANEQQCKDVCLEENGLTNIRYITNMSVNSENLGYVTFNGCYCYDSDSNLKYMYLIPV
jgi:hypothetical protein